MTTPFDNLGGIVSLDVILAAHLSQYIRVDGNIRLVLGSGKAWTNLPFTYGSAQPTEEPTESEAGELFAHEVTFKIPVISAANTAMLNAWRNVRIVAKMETSSGEYLMLGSPSYPAQLTYKLTPGTLASDFSGYMVTIAAKSNLPLGLLVL